MLRRAALAFLVGISAFATGGCSGERPLNLVVVVVDTLRADHLPLYGYDRDTAPYLSELAGEAVVFEHCVSPIPLTEPAMASLLTGAYPFRHGVRDTGYSMVEDVPTVTEILSGRGYHTAAFFSRAGLASTSGLGRGFALADDQTLRPEEMGNHPWHSREGAEMWQRRADEITDMAIDWLAHTGQEPFFLLIHYFDPHAHYDPPAPFVNRFEAEATPFDHLDLRSWWGPVSSLGAQIARYDEEILTVDHHLQRVVAELQRAGLWKRTAFVFTADHGESLGEHGAMDHGELLYEEQLHVPLLIRLPGQPRSGKTRVAQTVRLIDLMPTMLELLGVTEPAELPGTMAGQSLVPLLRGEGLDVAPVLLESESCPVPGDETNLRLIDTDCYPPGILGKLRGVHDGRWKLIVTPTAEGSRVELYDLAADPRELNDLSTQRPEVVQRLAGALETTLGPGSSGSVDHELVERLRALGYAE